MTRHPGEELSAYADGELSAERGREIELHLQGCTECRRELTIIRSIGNAMREIETKPTGIWDRVQRAIARPIGWGLLVAGFLLWMVLAAVAWFREEFTVEWLAATAIGTGLLMLLIHFGYEQYREWKESPYKGIQR
jgi:hypothetical protein